jgi:hypothetical protein
VTTGIPAAITPITVSGRYVAPNGAAATGTVTFTPSINALTPGALMPVSMTTKVTLDNTGAFSVILAATDDVDWVASGFYYQVTEDVRTTGTTSSRSARSYNIQVPAASPSGLLDLATVAPVVDPTVVTNVLLVTGGTLTGKLVLNTTSASTTYPTGYGTPVESGITVLSSYAGGDDDGAGGRFDSTGRINLYSFQRADVGSYGETLRNFLMRSDAKAMQAFYMPVITATKKGGYNGTSRNPLTSGISWRPVVWQGAHYEANDHGSVHGHWELEVADSTGALQGRLEIPFIDQTTTAAMTDDMANVVVGMDWTNIRTNLADFSVRAQAITSGSYSGQTTALRIGGNNAVQKRLLFSISSDMQESGRRWSFLANTTTEAGSNAGTDFQIIRHADDGSTNGTALGIERSTGNVLLGATPGAATAKLHIVPTAGKAAVGVYSTVTLSGGASYDAILQAATEIVVQSRVQADSSSRYRSYADGKLEWGSGSASRDTNLYRSAADQLATDDDFLVNLAGKGIRVKEGSNAKMGVATLVAGTVTVSNTNITATSRIQLTAQSLGTVSAPKALAVTARTAGTSFTITSSDNTDTSVVAYYIVEPA